MPKPYFLDIIGNISTSSRVIGNIAGAKFSEGEKIVVELDTLYDAVYTLANEKDTLATENADLRKQVAHLERQVETWKETERQTGDIGEEMAGRYATENEALCADNIRLRSDLQILGKKLVEANERIIDLEGSNPYTSQQNADLTRRVAALEAERDSALEQAVDAVSAANQLHNQLAELIKAVRTAKSYTVAYDIAYVVKGIDLSVYDNSSDYETVTAPADATEPPAGTGLQQGVVCGICYHSFDDPCENHPVCQDTGNPRADAPQYHFVTYTLYTNEDDADEETSPVAVWRSNAGLEAILVRAKAFANQHNTTVYVDWGDIYWDVISPDAPVCATCGDTRIIQELGEVADGEFEPHPIDCPDCVVQPLDSELDRFCVAEYGIPSLPTAKLREMLSERDNKLNNLKTVIALKPLELTVIRYFNEVRREIERREKLAAASEDADA